jgi:predicted ATPase
MLSQVAEAISVRTDWRANRLVRHVTELRSQLSSVRFIDFAPAAMRQPSVPGEKTINESGDNLSSVLRYLVEDQQKEAVLASWIKALTPMDVTRIGFEEYPDGKILAVLEEAGGLKVPLSGASDGTLRFLGILVSVISPEAPSLLCFEEIETGLHPVRVQLVSELLHKHAANGKPQVLLTTHSPALLGWLGREHRDHAYLAYRLPETADTRLKAFRDIPTLESALEKAEASRLFETGWFEEAVFFAEGQPTPISFVAEDEPEKQP